MAEFIRQSIRGQFVEYSVCFYVGADTEDLIEDIAQLAREQWALRTEDDT